MMGVSALKDLFKRSLDSLGLLRPVHSVVERLRGRFAPGSGGRYPGGLAPDGLPVPSSRVAALVGHTTADAFLESGREIAACIREVLGRHRLSPEGFGRLLDFGCGSGRVIRNWQSLADTEVHGCDYNPELAGWCERNLAFARFRTNGLWPPLSYPAEHFDFVYSFSVFTHLHAELPLPW